MKVYLCGSWECRDFLRKEMYKIEEAGHEITDWTIEEAEWFDIKKLREIAQRDANAVLSSDVVVGHLSNDVNKMRGTYTEIGIGIGADKLVILIAPSYRYIFKYLTNIVVVKNIYEAIEIIDDYEKSKMLESITSSVTVPFDKVKIGITRSEEPEEKVETDEAILCQCPECNSEKKSFAQEHDKYG